jgi:DNA repair exonuclease SbcCD nuclease subunit
MVRIIYIGDVHLERLVNLLAEMTDAVSTIQLQLSALRMVYNYARKQGVRHIIYLGDLFHTAAPQQTTIALFLQFLREYPEMFNYLIPGNHDFSMIGVHAQQTLSAIGKFIEGSNIYVFDKPTVINIEGVPLFMCPWPYTVGHNIHGMVHIDAPKTPHLCIGHFDIDGAQYPDYSVRNNTRSENLGTHNFWIIGHIHLAQKHYPGTLYQVNFDEPPEKGFVETWATFSNGKLQIKSQWHQIKPVYTLHNIVYTDEAQLREITVSKINFWKLSRRKNSPLVPQQWLLNHPNVTVGGVREPTPLNLPINVILPMKALQDIKPDWNLKEFLEERQVPPHLIARGIEIVHGIIQRI